MRDEDRPKDQLIRELNELRVKISTLEKSDHSASGTEKNRDISLLRIPVKSATQSGGNRPLVPVDSGHLFGIKAARYRSEATLVFC